MNTIREFVPEDFTPDREIERKEAAFKDFLLLKRITGDLKREHKTDLIPQDVVQESGETVIIEIPPEEHEQDNTKFIIHRTVEGEIEKIELVCTCSKKHVIKFSYEDLNKENRAPDKNEEMEL